MCEPFTEAQHSVHQVLKYSGSTTEAQRHNCELKQPFGGCESHLLLILRSEGHLPVPLCQVEDTHVLHNCLTDLRGHRLMALDKL